MSENPGTNEGWHLRRSGGSAPGSQEGPLSWTQLFAMAHAGQLAPDDMVWHPTLPAWAPARNIPGLMAPPAAPAPAPQPQYAPPPQQPQYAAAPQAQAPAPPRKHHGRTVALTLLAVAVVAAIGIGAFMFFSGDGDGGLLDGIMPGSTPDMGVSEVKLPDSTSLVMTDDWGEVPANQIGITLADGAARSDAEAVAESLSGSIVGEVEYISMYQIEFTGTTEADLRAAIDTAANAPGVELAFPNQQIELDVEIWGTRYSSYDDPVYGGGNGNGYKAVGVDRAWTFIKAAGVELSSVHVGIVDNGLYREGEGRENEFGGDVKISFPDPDSGELDERTVNKNGKANDAGSHGTGVATIIGADPDNGGPSGIAGPLGAKLEISMINQYSGKYGTIETTPDPNDPTKLVYSDGKTYTQGSFVAINKQIEAGATIINCSWGKVDAHPAIAAAYKKYFENLATDHPNILFVCSGGNNGESLDGTKRYPSGLALPNMITVGALNNDGTLADYASKSSDNYEVTMGAPGTSAVVGVKADGTPEMQSGSSFAAPHVAAAAAILRAINPELTAGEIKQLLVDTARPGTTVGDTSNLAPPEAGGRVLAIDDAVLRLINDQRAEKGPAPVTAESLEQMGAVDAVAISGENGEWTVMGMVDATGDGGCDLKIDVSAENHFIGGTTTQSLSGPGEAEWSVTLTDDTGIITVTRLDTGASSVINVDKLDINGAWSGTFTITKFDVTDPEAAGDEGCTAEIMNALVGTPFPMSMDISVDEGGTGTAVSLIDVSSLGDDASSEPQNLSVSFSGSTITFSGGSDLNQNMTATVTRDTNQLVMRGTSTSGGDGWVMTAAFTLTKPE